MNRKLLLCLGLLFFLLVALPVLLSPEIPPLDLSNHLGRAYILGHLPSSPGLRALYDVAWAPTPNLAADLLLTPLVLLLGPRPAVRLFAGLSLLAMAAAFAALSRVARGRWDATALLGIPLAHNLHFNYGFINYYWGVAAALGSFAASLHVLGSAKGGRPGPRPAGVLLMMALGLCTYLMHLVGFGALLVALSASLLVRLWQSARAGGSRAALVRELLLGAGAIFLVALGPALLYLGYSRGAVGGAGLHRLVTWTPPKDKLLGILRVLRAGRPLTDLPLLGLVAAACGLGVLRLRTFTEGRQRALGAGLALLALCLVMPGSLDLETSDIDLRVALPALLCLVAALAELPARPALRCAALLALGLACGQRGAGAQAAWRLASQGIIESRRLCPVLRPGARVVTLHNEVPRPGEVEHGAGERHGWAYCLFEKPLFFPSLFHVPGSQPLRLRLPAYEGTDTLAHYHVKNGFSNPAMAREIPWPALAGLADSLWLTGWDLAEADPAGLLPRRCLEEAGRQPRVVVYRVRREVPGCSL